MDYGRASFAAPGNVLLIMRYWLCSTVISSLFYRNIFTDEPRRWKSLKLRSPDFIPGKPTCCLHHGLCLGNFWNLFYGYHMAFGSCSFSVTEWRNSVSWSGRRDAIVSGDRGNAELIIYSSLLNCSNNRFLAGHDRRHIVYTKLYGILGQSFRQVSTLVIAKHSPSWCR